MKLNLAFSVFSVLIFSANDTNAQKRTDTTLKIGKVGYHVICSNKDAVRNELDIKPLGFDNEARETMVYIKGRVTTCEIDDLNGDGFPDMLIFTMSGPKGAYGDAYAIVSAGNKRFVPVGLPDVQLDAKYKEGYRGQDEFSLVEGTLMRKYPIYKAEDTDKPTGGKRVIQYQLSGNAETGFKFSPLQSFDIK